MDPLEWPFVLTMLLLGAAIVALGTINWRAMRAVLWPLPVEGNASSWPRARISWLLSVTAFFSGPLAPVLGLLVALVGWRARRNIEAGTPSDAPVQIVATAAIRNGLALCVVGAWIIFAVWLASLSH